MGNITEFELARTHSAEQKEELCNVLSELENKTAQAQGSITAIANIIDLMCKSYGLDATTPTDADLQTISEHWGDLGGLLGQCANDLRQANGTLEQVLEGSTSILHFV